MNRHRLIVLALAGGLLTATIPSLTHAQIGDALVHAEQACLDHGIAPNSAAFNVCVERAAMAYDRDRPELADREARIARAARDDCLRSGMDPHTPGYRACVDSEIDRRSGFAPPYNLILNPNARWS